MIFLSVEPQIKAVKDSYWEEDRTSQEKAPGGMTKAIEDVCEPCNEAGNTNYATHLKISNTVLKPMIGQRMTAIKNSVPACTLFSLLFISIPL